MKIIINKTHLIFFYSYIIFFIFLSGCAVSLENLISNELPDIDQGILITKIRTNVRYNRVTIHERIGKKPFAIIDDINPIEDLRVVSITSGDSVLGKFQRGSNFVFKTCNYFTIEPGTINYVGDLVIEWSVEEGMVVAYVLIIDREEETVSEAKEKYPWIFEKYTYKKNITACM